MMIFGKEHDTEQAIGLIIWSQKKNEWNLPECRCQLSAALHNESATERNVSSSFIRISFYVFPPLTFFLDLHGWLILFPLFFITYIISSFSHSPFPYSINIVLFSSPHTPTGRYPAYDGYPLYIINWQIGQVLYFILLLCHGLCDFVSYDKKIAICRMKSFHFNIINFIHKNYKYSRSIMHLLPIVNDESFIWFDLITNI